MKITWLGTASILIEDKDTVLLVDPFLKKTNSTLPPFPMEILKKVQAILITHPHFDHFGDIKEIIKYCHAKVYVGKRGIEIAKKNGINTSCMVEIKAPMKLLFDNIQVNIIQGRHCVFDDEVKKQTLKRALRLTNLKAALKLKKLSQIFSIDFEKDVFAFEFINKNKNIFLLGSANLMDTIDYPTHMDILIFPYQGRSDMAAYSLSIIERLKPSCLFLDHFDDAFPPISNTMNTEIFISMAKQHFSDMKIIQPHEAEQFKI